MARGWFTAVVVLFAVASACTMAQTTGSAVMQLGAADSGKQVQLVPGQLFQISLAENATTGFSWAVEADGSPACKLIDDVSEYPGGPLGAPGTRHFLFRARQEGTGAVRLAYRRPWETNPPEQVFLLDVRVAAQAGVKLTALSVVPGDMDGDGRLTLADVTILLRRVVGLP